LLFFEWLDSLAGRLQQLDDKLAPFTTSSQPTAIALSIACAMGDFGLALAFWSHANTSEQRIGFASSQISRLQLKLGLSSPSSLSPSSACPILFALLCLQCLCEGRGCA
jgi:hypothetical protein